MPRFINLSCDEKTAVFNTHSEQFKSTTNRVQMKDTVKGINPLGTNPLGIQTIFIDAFGVIMSKLIFDINGQKIMAKEAKYANSWCYLISKISQIIFNIRVDN